MQVLFAIHLQSRIPYTIGRKWKTKKRLSTF